MMLWSPCGVCQIWNMEYVIGCVRIYACAYLLLNVLRVERHVVFGVARLVLSIHDNFGDEDENLEDLYGRKGEGHPIQDSHDFSRGQMKVIRFEISGEFRSL